MVEHQFMSYNRLWTSSYVYHVITVLCSTNCPLIYHSHHLIQVQIYASYHTNNYFYQDILSSWAGAISEDSNYHFMYVLYMYFMYVCVEGRYTVLCSSYPLMCMCWLHVLWCLPYILILPVRGTHPCYLSSISPSLLRIPATPSPQFAVAPCPCIIPQCSYLIDAVTFKYIHLWLEDSH